MAYITIGYSYRLQENKLKKVKEKKGANFFSFIYK